MPEEPPVCSPLDPLVNPRAKTAGLDLLTPKPGVEINLGKLLSVSPFIPLTDGVQQYCWQCCAAVTYLRTCHGADLEFFFLVD